MLGYSGNGNFYYDQFRDEDNYCKYLTEYQFPILGDYSDFDQFMNNTPNFFNNQFLPPPAFNRRRQYGLNYGYFNPYF